MKKRIFAGLLTLVMVFTLLPVSALAAGVTVPVTVNKGSGKDYGLNTHNAILNAGKPNATIYVGQDAGESSGSKYVNETGTWKILTVRWVGSNHYTPTDYMVPEDSVTVSKEGIIGDISVDLVPGLDSDGHHHQCVQLSYKALAAGTVTVNFKYYYNPGLVNYDTRWYQGTGTATITVIGKPTSTPNVSTNKFEDVIKFKCDTDDSHNATADFNDPNVTNGYSYGEIIDNDGENSLFPVSTYPWMCVVTLNTQAYLDGYNKVLSGTNGTHYLAENQGAEETFTFYYSKNDGTWWYDKGAFPVIDITCTEPEPDPKPDPKPDAPVSPSYGDLKSVIGKIQVKDVSKPDCGTESYDLIDNTQSESFNWTKTARLDQPGTYDVTIKTAPYVAKYNSDKGKTHELNDAGQTTLNLVISYNDKKWVLDGSKAEIEVKHTESTPTETPPNAPTADALKKLEMAVQVKCVVDNSQQHTVAYGLLGNDGDYFVGEPRKDGDDWLCDISYVPDLYVAKFNTTFQNLKHVQNDEKIVPVTLIWAGGSWQLKTQGRVHVTEEYTVTFNAYGGFPTPDKQHVKSGEKAVLPVAPTLKGHTFAFWYLGEDEQTATAYNFGTPVTENITLTAKWNINKYTVTFDTDGGTPVPPAQEVEYGRTAVEPASAPTKTGYTFDGWYLGNEKYVFSDAVEQDITLKAKWEAIPYGVTYSYVSGTEGAALPGNVNDSLPVNENTYTIGQQVPTAAKPDDVVFGEYTWKFQGWTLNGTAVAPNTRVPMAKGGLHFVGTWIRTSAQDEEYPVTYSYVSGVEGVELPEEVKATLPVNKDTYTIGQQVPTAAKPANVTVGDYIWSLKAWKLGDNEIVPNNSVPMVKGGLNFVGIWTREKATVTVTFDANGGTVAPTSKTITKGSTLTLPTPVLSGYRFDGWFTEKTGGTQVNAGATFDKDTTLYAHWTKNSSGGGGGSSSRDYDYTLRYVTNGGKSIASETKSKRWTKDYEDLPMPTRAGYRFDGWYYDSALKNEVTGDVKVNSRTVTLYAGWTGSSVPDSLNGEDHFAYVQGYADGTVRPNTPVTRAQVATILFRLLDESVRKEYLTENNTFTDVASNYWANTAISTMANMGVFKGRTADRFDPNAPITRGEFAAVCARFDDSKVKTTETYSDIDGYWAANEILRAAALGWVQGYQDGSYRPNNSITRAQVVTMINRVLCRMPEKNADLLKGMSSFTDCAEDDWCYLAIQEATNSHDYKTKSGSIHEKWTDLNTAPDWSRFEH